MEHLMGLESLTWSIHGVLIVNMLAFDGVWSVNM